MTPTAYRIYLEVVSTIVHCTLLLRDLLYRVCYIMEIAQPPTPGTRTVTKEFLSAMFGQTVTAVTSRTLDDNRGFVGNLLRVEVDFADVTTSLMLKTSQSSRAGRKHILFGTGGVREALFYKSVFSSRLKEFGRIPKTYYAHGSRWMGEMVVLMEDLQGAAPVNQLLGNQIWGVPPGTPTVDKLELLHALYLHAAGLHAQYWRDPSILKERWMRSAAFFHGGGRLEWEISMDTSNKGWTNLKNNTEINFPDGFIRRLDNSYANAKFDLVVQHCRTLPWTLTHGDYHAANMMVVLGDDRSANGLLNGLKVFDWSEVGPWEPTTDLAQPCISDLPRELYPQVRAVLKEYHKALISMGVDDYPWEDCERRFGDSGMERWIWVLGCMAHFPCPPTLFQYFVDQMEAFRLEFCPGSEEFMLNTCGYFWGA
jgi:hypothetical protein